MIGLVKNNLPIIELLCSFTDLEESDLRFVRAWNHAEVQVFLFHLFVQLAVLLTLALSCWETGIFIWNAKLFLHLVSAVIDERLVHEFAARAKYNLIFLVNICTVKDAVPVIDRNSVAYFWWTVWNYPVVKFVAHISRLIRKHNYLSAVAVDRCFIRPLKLVVSSLRLRVNFNVGQTISTDELV